MLGNPIYHLSHSKELKNISLNHYMGYQLNFESKNPFKSYWLSSDYKIKSDIRKEIVSTLKDTHYCREEDKWTNRIVAAFIQESVYDLFDSNSDTKLNNICYRYNIPESKINKLISTFINLRQSYYSLKNYFTDYELLYIKYRNPKTLAKNLKENKITINELEMLEEMNFIAFDKKSKQYKLV